MNRAAQDDWDRLTLGELTKGTRPICYGVLKPGPHTANGVPLIRVTDISDNRFDNSDLHCISRALDEEFRRSRLNGGEILVSIQGTVGRVAICPRQYAGANISRTIAVVEPDGRADRSYLYWYLRSLGENGKFHTVGTTRSSLNIEALRKVEVPLPPLPEQRRIAEVLDRTEALRAKRRAALAQLDTLTQAIFLDLFGDPVVNPMGWPNPTLGGVLCSQQYGPRFYNEAYTESGVRIVRITDLSEAGVLDFSTMPRLAVSDDDRQKYQLKPGDVIFARTGATVGKVALIQPGDPDCIAGAYFIRLRFASSVEPAYARAVLTSGSIRLIVTNRSRQAAQQNFSGPALRELPMPVPPIDHQRDFVRRIAAVDKLKNAYRASLTELDSLFASLQHRAFRGEL